MKTIHSKLSLLLISIIVFAYSCKTEKKESKEVKVESIEVINKAQYLFAGRDKTVLKEGDLGYVLERVNDGGLQQLKKRPQVNANYGFIEVLALDKSFFLVIFTAYDGEVISYNGTYYKDDELANFLRKKLNMSKEKLKEVDGYRN